MTIRPDRATYETRLERYRAKGGRHQPRRDLRLVPGLRGQRGIWRHGRYYVRSEDVMVVGREGSALLTRFTYEPVVIA